MKVVALLLCSCQLTHHVTLGQALFRNNKSSAKALKCLEAKRINRNSRSELKEDFEVEEKGEQVMTLSLFQR
jgi:hypothetical protein